MPVADHDVTASGRAATPGDERGRGAGHAARDAHHEVDVHLAAVRQPVAVQQPAQRSHVAEVEQLELRDHLALLAELVELGDERPRVGEHVVAEVGGAHRQAARVGSRVEDLEPLVERVVHGPAGRELDDEVGALAQRGDRVGEPTEVERGPVLGVADVHVDHRGTGGLALLGRRHQLLERGRELGTVLLGGLGAGGGHGDQQRFSHGRHAARSGVACRKSSCVRRAQCACSARRPGDDAVGPSSSDGNAAMCVQSVRGAHEDFWHAAPRFAQIRRAF